MKTPCLSGLIALLLTSPLFAAQLVVTTLIDEFDTPSSGASLSLREAIRDAAATGDTITFFPLLNGGVVPLTGGQLVISKNITIDASSLSKGLNINANSQSRIFSINSGRTVILRGLTLTDGFAAATGGAIFNDRANLTLNACTLSGNSTGGLGGAIYNNADSSNALLTLNSCTLSGNSANLGGAIYNAKFVNGNAPVVLNACTVSANYATSEGGGIYNRIFTGGSATVSLHNTIVAGNIAGIYPDMRDVNGAISNATGRNLLSDAAGSTLSENENVIVQTPRLAPLGHYGGAFLTMPPLAGSPAIDNAGGVNPGGTDQRGFTRFVNDILDIGAVETGPVTLVNNAGDDVGTATTLRKALADTAATQGAVIRFDPAVFNGETADTIILSSATQLEIPGTANGLLIDASNITGGVTLDADRQSRVLDVAVGSTAALQGLILTGGYAKDEPPGDWGDWGGAIYNDQGTLTLNACTIKENSANFGGAILNNGLTTRATLSLNACTVAGNSAELDGGAIYNFVSFGSARMNFESCTISGNSAGVSAGGILSNAGGGSAQITLSNTILAGNTANNNPDFAQSDSTTVLRGKNLLADLSGSGLTAGPSVIVGLPRLAPLGNYGGPTPTMPPLAGSPAIGAAGTVHPGGNDQRGFARLVGGVLDIGAVELGPVTLVNNTGDSAATATTLRKALADTASIAGAVIRFDSVVFNGESLDTITLGSTQLEIPGSANGLFIDASNITGGVTIHASASRVLEVKSGATAALHGLMLTGGNATGTSPDDYGGAIYNDHASLTLNASTLAGNSANYGGGIYNDGGDSGRAYLALNSSTLSGNSATTSGGGVYNTSQASGSSIATLNASTLSGNSGQFAGAIFNDGTISGSATLNLNSCTLSGNNASNTAGAIYNNGTAGNANLTLSACTLSGNSGTAVGGVMNYAPTGNSTLTLENTIVAGNTAAIDPDVAFEGATLTTWGINLITDDSTIPAGPSVIVGDPHLAPLGDYGGPTRTMPPLADSPAIDAAGTTHPGGADQRGFPRFIHAALDIGAVETGPVTLVDNSGDGATTATTLRKALADTAATAGAVIRFDPQLFNGEPADTIKLIGGQLEIPGSANGLFVDASNISGGVTLDASPATSGHVLKVGPGAVTALHGLTLTGGNATLLAFPGNSGGAIFNDRATLTLNACTITGNSAFSGGGFYNNGDSGKAALSLNGCMLLGNFAVYGGAVHNFGSGSSGIAVLTLHTCVLSGNSAVTSGGGIYSSYQSSGRASNTLVACTLSANSAPNGFGGGIYTQGSGPARYATLTNCVLWENGEGIADSGSIFSFNTIAEGSSHNLLQQNGAADGTAVVSKSNPQFVRAPNPGDGNWNTVGNNDYGDLRLRAGSPAIDAGDSAAYFRQSGTLTDLAAQTRFYDDPGTSDTGIGTITHLDLGAYEGAHTNFAATYPALDPALDANHNGISNFGDYASGTDPTAADDGSGAPVFVDDKLTFSYRPYALDVLVDFQKSTTLQAGSWSTMTEGVDYDVSAITGQGIRGRITLDLNFDPVTDPRMFFRERFTPAP